MYYIYYIAGAYETKPVSENAMKKKKRILEKAVKRKPFRKTLCRKTRFGERYEEKPVSVNAMKKNPFR